MASSFLYQHEWRLIRSDKVSLALLFLMLVFSAFALFTGASWTKFQRENLALAQQDAQETNQRLKQKLTEDIQTNAVPASHADPGSAAYVGARLRSGYALLPPAPLAAVAIGQSDLLPYYYRVTSFDRQSLIHAEEIDNPGILYLGHFDLAFVLIFMLPLFIIAFTYNLVSRERENGTMPLLLAQPLPVRRLFLHKFLFRAGMVLLVVVGLLLLFGVGAGARLWAPEVRGSFVQLLLAVGLYAAFWLCLSFLVASFNRTSAFNALCLLGLWLLLVVLVPSFLNSAANERYPLPSRLALINAQREATLDAAENGTQLISRMYEDHPEFVSQPAENLAADREVSSYVIKMEAEKVAVPFEQQHRQQVDRQHQLLQKYQLLSPAIVLQQELNEIAGNGKTRRAAFEAQTDSFQAAIRSYFQTKVFKKERLVPQDYDQMPAFVYQEPTPGQSESSWYLLFLGVLTPAGLALAVATGKLKKISA